MFARALQVFLLAALSGVPTYAFGLEHQGPKPRLEIFEGSADTQWHNRSATPELHWGNRSAGEWIASGCFLAPKAGEAETFKEPKAGASGKEGAKDVPSWAKGQRPKTTESGKDFAKRLLDGKYGPGNWKRGPGSEFNKIKKWGDRSFE